MRYDENCDAAFCCLCSSAEKQGKLKAASKESAFLSKGFTNWKDTMEGFRKHEKSRCHIDALQVMGVLPKTVPDVGEVLSSAHPKEKAHNWTMLVRILRNMKFFGRQGLPLRGHDDFESNFIQLLRLQELSDPTVKAWMQRRVDKYCSPEIQNEMLKLMSLELLRGIAHNLHSAEMFSIMADECTDAS